MSAKLNARACALSLWVLAVLVSSALVGCEESAGETCGPGTKLVGQTCVTTPPAGESCGPGTVLVGNQCLPIAVDAVGADGVTGDTGEVDAAPDVSGASDVAEPIDTVPSDVEPTETAGDTDVATTDTADDVSGADVEVAQDAPVATDSATTADGTATDDAAPDVAAPEDTVAEDTAPDAIAPDVQTDAADSGPPCPDGCAVGFVCGSSGTCVPDPNVQKWKCAPAAKGDGSECNCNCGMVDPDCSDATLPVVGCTSGICNADGTCGTCVPACDGKQCGPDGCGGTCGLCVDAFALYCQDGKCVTSCQPDCEGKLCGDNGCGGVCGVCGKGTTCELGQCLAPPAELSCNNYCGGNAPGGCSCAKICLDTGNCCVDAELECGCLSQCLGLSCGDDGCGGTCGTCGDSELCVDGACTPDLCSPDPCGGHGTCIPQTGSCICESPYAGVSCSECEPGYTNYPLCTPDKCYDTVSPCGAHGTCQSADGSCACEPGFGGVACDVCLDGVSTYPNCTDSCAGLSCDDGNACTKDTCGVTSTFYFDCVDAYEQGQNKSGLYWIDPDGDPEAKPFQAWCDMETDGGGWTMCATSNGALHPKAEFSYDPTHPYSSNGYRSDCRNVPMTEVLYVRHSDEAKAWFTQDTPSDPPTRLGTMPNAWNVGGAVFGTFTGHGVASTNEKYEFAACDSGWMWTGLMTSRHIPGCYKACNDWCADTTGTFFRYDGDYPGGGFIGVAFNEIGHTAQGPTLMSVGLRRRVPVKPTVPGQGGFATLGCVHTTQSGACDDGQPCTLEDACVAGTCVGGEKGCDIAVTASDDTFDGKCDSTHCSLREALIVINSSPGAQTIGLAVEGTISLSSDLPDLVDSVSVVSLGADVEINGMQSHRAFTASADLTLSHLKLRQCSGADGGAIQHTAGTLTLDHVVLENNSSSTVGGAIAAGGILDARWCSFVSNNAVGSGGALFVAPGATVTVARSSLASNTSAMGGAIACDGASTLVNSSLIYNTASTEGGAISGNGAATLLHCTLAENVAPVGSASTVFTLQLLNSLLMSATTTGPMCEINAQATTGSVVLDSSCGSPAAGAFAGPIPFPLAYGVMAAFDYDTRFVDAADAATCALPAVQGVDQYGAPRPIGQACDVGAFEYYPDFQSTVP